MKRPVFRIMPVGFLVGAITISACTTSPDQIRKEQEAAWVLRVNAVTQEIPPIRRRATREVKTAVAAGDRVALANVYAAYANDLLPIQRRLERIETPSQCLEEQRGLLRFFRATRSAISRLANPAAFTPDRLEVVFSQIAAESSRLLNVSRHLKRTNRC